MNYLYMAVDGDACKIGYSNNPRRRAKELYYPSYIDGVRNAPIVAAWLVGDAAREAERQVKEALAPYELPYAGEWYTISRKEMVMTIRRVLRGLGITGKAYRYLGRRNRPTGRPRKP